MLPWITSAVPFLNKKGTPEIFQTFVDVAQVDGFDSDTTPWSGLFMGYCFAQNGIEPPDNLLDGKSWTNFGNPLQEPAFGCVMVFDRGPEPAHVALYLGEDDNWYFILGGHQGDMVNIAAAAKSRAIAYRWPLGADNLLKVGRVNTTIDAATKSIEI